MRLGGILILTLVLAACGGGSGSDPAEPSAISVADDRVVVDAQHLATPGNARSIWRSSSFFVPKTSAGYRRFVEDYPRHASVRLHLVEMALHATQGAGTEDERIARGIAYLDARASMLTEIGARSDAVLLPLVRMPDWLSSSDDHSILHAGDGWLVSNAMPPADMAAWTRTLVALTTHCAELLGDGPRLYLEIWNEPDLYWLGGSEAWLELYAASAVALRSALPQARIGGPAMNQWDGTLEGEDTPLTRTLIERATDDRLPLDFLAWHCFISDPDEIDLGVAAARRWLAEAGAPAATELVISEWNAVHALRGSRFQLGLAAELLWRCGRLGIAHETVAAWEDYNPLPVGDNSDYGLLRQDGTAKPIYALHEAFDQLARDAVSAQSASAGSLRVCAARDSDGTLRLLLWDLVVEPHAAAVGRLRATIGLEALAEAYAGQDASALFDDIRALDPPLPQWQEAYTAARAALLEAEAKLAAGTRSLSLHLPGVTGEAELQAIGDPPLTAPVHVPLDRGSLDLELAPNEILLIEVGGLAPLGPG